MSELRICIGALVIMLVLSAFIGSVTDEGE
jgi:hypothetical protein